MKEMKKKQSVKQVLSNNWFLFKICISAAPLYVVLYIIEAIRLEVFIFIEHTYGIGFVLEAAEFHYPFWRVGKFLIILFLAICFFMVYSAFIWERIEPKGKIRILEKLRLTLYDKAKQLDLEKYDDPEYYNDFVLTMSEAENQVNRMLTLLKTMFSGITMFITTGIYFLIKDKTATIFVIGSFIGTFIFTQIYNRLNFDIRLKRNPFERKLQYVSRVFYLSDYAKEHRLHPEVSNQLYEEFEKTTEEISNIYKENGKKRFWLSFLRTYVFNDFLNDVVFVTYLIYQAAVLHNIAYSTVVILFNSSGRLKHGLRLFTEIYPYASENSLYVQKIRDFLETEPEIVSTANRKMPTEQKTFEFRDVSFAYSKESGNVINHLNIVIHPKEKIALVGYNGAGKTTLIKLLMRLYDVTEGEILYDGINIKEYDIKEYRKHIGTVFQDYVLFGATLKENVVMDDAKDVSDSVVTKALVDAGFGERLKTLPNGLQTDITTEFAEDGVNLSGGESQKLAISRVFYHDASLMILDEPSSALDPIAEYQLNHSMMKAANHKTVIFISHRLSTTRLADKIIMLEHGQVIESGSHEELLAKKGAYAAMWRAQAGQYIQVEG